MKPRLLFLFAEGWDEVALPRLAQRFEIFREGFDLHRFPGNARILWFDAPAFVERLVRKYRRSGLAGVISTHEQYGALIAACVARRLGLPGTDPAAVVRAQHKYLARQVLARALPDHTPPFALLPYTFARTRLDEAAHGLPYPFFVKPVKAAFSVLAKRIDSGADLARHLAFRPWERHIIRRLVAPFRALLPGIVDCSVDPEHLLAEGIEDGVQLNVDGFADRGAVVTLGVVDEVMYPGTNAFQRFEYPSRAPAAVQARASAVAEAAVRALGFDHGCWNVELFWRPADGRISVIEINPRLAAQFDGLYADVDGSHPYDVLADLATGRAPAWSRRAGRCGAAGSFVWREFGAAEKGEPPASDRQWLAQHHPGAVLQTYVKRGQARWREMRWLGSYRYAIVNLGASDREQLLAWHADIDRHLRFEAHRAPAPERPVPAPGYADD